MDVKQEKRIDDYWNVDGSKDFSDPLTNFTQFTFMGRKNSRRTFVVRVEINEETVASRPEHLWPELWESMGKNAKLKEKQIWYNEKLHFENARKLRGNCFIGPEDTEFKETIKNARKKLETSIVLAMPCKMKKIVGVVHPIRSKKKKTRLACVLEIEKSTRLCVGEFLLNHHEDHISGKSENSLQHYNLVHKFIPMLQGMKIPAAKAAVDKEWENWRNFRVEPDKSQKWKGGDR